MGAKRTGSVGEGELECCGNTHHVGAISVAIRGDSDRCGLKHHGKIFSQREIGVGDDDPFIAGGA